MASSSSSRLLMPTGLILLLDNDTKVPLFPLLRNRKPNLLIGFSHVRDRGAAASSSSSSPFFTGGGESGERKSRAQQQQESGESGAAAAAKEEEESSGQEGNFCFFFSPFSSDTRLMELKGWYEIFRGEEMDAATPENT